MLHVSGITLYDPLDLVSFTSQHLPSPTSNIPFLTISRYAYLKESLQPPDLEYAFPNQNSQLKYAPPFDPAVCTFSCIAVGPLTDNDVGLFIFDLIQELRELFHCRSKT